MKPEILDTLKAANKILQSKCLNEHKKEKDIEEVNYKK